jgi:hypothetical protein
MSAYAALIFGLPGYEACPIEFTAASTRACAGCVKLILQVTSGAVWLQFGHGAIPVWESYEELVLPTQGSLVRPFDAVRVRAFSASSPPQVILTPIGGAAA